MHLPALTHQLENLHHFAHHAAQSVKARGTMLTSCLQDIPEHAKQIALHGVRHGATVALASVQACSGYELRFLPMVH